MAEVAGCIGHPCPQQMGAVGGEVGSGRETPTAPANGCIAKEGAAGIDAQALTGSQSSRKAAGQGGFAVVTAGPIGQVAPLAADVVADALDRSSLGRHSSNQKGLTLLLETQKSRSHDLVSIGSRRCTRCVKGYQIRNIDINKV